MNRSVSSPVIRKLSLSLALVVSACAVPPAPVAETSAPVIEQPVPVQTPVVVEPAPVQPEIPEPIAVDMGRIENQTPTDVVDYLGTPTLVRRDDIVQVMIFETGTCVVEVIFYEPANGDHFRARRVNARSTSGQNVDTENCVRRQLEKNR